MAHNNHQNKAQVTQDWWPRTGSAGLDDKDTWRRTDEPWQVTYDQWPNLCEPVILYVPIIFMQIPHNTSSFLLSLGGGTKDQAFL